MPSQDILELYSNDTLLTTDEKIRRLRVSAKMSAEYNKIKELPAHLQTKLVNRSGTNKVHKSILPSKHNSKIALPELDQGVAKAIEYVQQDLHQKSLVQYVKPKSDHQHPQNNTSTQPNALSTTSTQIKPDWHAPWKLMRVISGHQGWVRSVCVEPDNQWFATGSADRTIKIWDLASGRLKVTLTGHIMTVRGLVVSPRHPYLFSAGEDKMVKCWDLEQNQVIRHYHGHLSSVYSIDLHPTLDLIVTAGRDSVARVWDIRTRDPVHVLTGHKSAISRVKCQPTDPQILTSSMDSTVRLWDLRAGKTMAVLTHHKKAVRDLAVHPTEFTFATASADNIKEWRLPAGDFMHNFYPQHNAVVNSLSVNQDGVMFSGGDNGSISWFDWKSGHKFQATQNKAIPGSLESENSILTSTFDRTGLRLITGEADKSIKVWREDPEATEETHPNLPWEPQSSMLY